MTEAAKRLHEHLAGLHAAEAQRRTEAAEAAASAASDHAARLEAVSSTEAGSEAQEGRAEGTA